MPAKVRYRCLNCGHRFDVNVLTPDERQEAERERRPVSGIRCPECGRSDYREGWD